MAQRVRRRLPPLLLGLFALAALLHAPVAAQALPRLSIAPLAGPCGPGDPPLTVRGADFPPGQAIAVLSRRAGYTERVPKLLVGRATVAADGAFVIRERPSDCDPSAADGTRFILDVVPDPGPAGALAGIPVLASAPFTKSAAAPRACQTPAAARQRANRQHGASASGSWPSGYSASGAGTDTGPDRRAVPAPTASCPSVVTCSGA